MRIVTSTSLAVTLASAIFAVGCGSSTTPSTTPSATVTTPPSGSNETAPPATGPATAPAAAMPGATHVLTADEPYYTTDPGTAGQGMAPAGMLKAGTPVLVMVPGKTYCKIISNQGTSCYTLTSGLKPISDK
jgi:hypothetical protein